jgi:hypothetical protein
MNYGQKLTKLKDSLGITHWTKYGEIVGIPGTWLADQSKKDSVQIVDIPRLIKIVEYHQISLDYLLRDTSEDISIEKNDDLSDDDILKIIEKIKEQVKEKDVRFNGFLMSEVCKNITVDSLEILEGIIKNNL